MLEVLGGSLYAQAIQYDDDTTMDPNGSKAQNIVHKLTGNTWTFFNAEILSSFAQGQSTLFNGQLIYQTQFRLKTFDGTTRQNVYDKFIYDFFIKDDYLYVLETSGRVLQTKDLSVWQPVEEFDSTARHIAVHGDTMFLGDSVGKLWISDKTYPRPTLSYLPAIYHLIED